MLYPVNLRILIHKLLLELQSRLDRSRHSFAPLALDIHVDEQRCMLRLNDDGILEVRECDEPKANPLRIPNSLFWQMLFGTTAWERVRDLLALQGNSISGEVSDLMAALFPVQEVIYWGPDHF